MASQLQLDLDRRAELDARIERILRGAVLPSLDEHELELLRILALHKGATFPVKADQVLDLFGWERKDCNRRWVKATVEMLVNLYRLPIGALRVPPYGYFLIVSRQDLELAIHPLWGEVYALLRRLRALTSKQEVARLFGQAMLELDEEKPKEAA